MPLSHLLHAALALVLAIGPVSAQTRGAIAPPGAATPVIGVWLVETLGQDVGVSTRLYLDFSTDGKVSGSEGCNGISATLKVEATTATFESLQRTLTVCGGVMERADAFYEALADTRAVAVEEGRLILKDSSGNLLVRIVPL